MITETFHAGTTDPVSIDLGDLVPAPPALTLAEQYDALGLFAEPEACAACKGEGRGEDAYLCVECGGSGVES